MDKNAFSPMAAFPQGMDFLKQLWAQGLAAQTAMPSMAAPAAVPNPFASSPFASIFPSMPQAAPSGAAGSGTATTSPAGGMTQAFQQAIASYFMPTFDVAELDKRIGDMRTVLQFMELNSKLLQQSVQALEVQRNTVAALHSMMQPTDAAPHAAPTAATQTPARGSRSAPPSAPIPKAAPKKRAAPAKKAKP